MRSLGGIKDMDALPDALFVVDVGHEEIAVHEARKLGIPVVAVVDSNCSPDGIDYVDSRQRRRHAAIQLYAGGIADAVIDGKSSVPDVPAGEDEFVELDEEGKPRRKPPRARAQAGERPPQGARAPRQSAETSSAATMPPVGAVEVVIGRAGATKSSWTTCAARDASRRDAAGRAPPATAAGADACETRPCDRGRMTMAVTAEAVKTLRERTGAGMMECKKALVETGGDLDAAAEIMRKSGLAKADKKAGRIAAEGMIASSARQRRPFGGAGRGQLRDGLRRARARVPGLRRPASRVRRSDSQPASLGGGRCAQAR